MHKTSLWIERIQEERAAEYGAVVATLFGRGSPVDRWCEAVSLRMGWACFGAFDGSRLVGVGAMHVADTLGWLGAAATFEDARGRGAQSALLAARIRAASGAGARVVATETVDHVDGEAGPSFRNVVRAGFDEACVQQWWFHPHPSSESGQNGDHAPPTIASGISSRPAVCGHPEPYVGAVLRALQGRLRPRAEARDQVRARA